eukprot:PITA_20777
MSGYATAQKILRVGYFWPSIFKDCILVVCSCHVCQIYQWKMHATLVPLLHVITMAHFAKWSIYFMTCNLHLAREHGYIIIVIDYFTKWAQDATGLTPFQLIYGLEVTRMIECEIPPLKLAVELLLNTTPVEKCVLYLEWLDETRRLASLVIKAQKKRVKTHFDQIVTPCSFIEGDLVLLYD